MENQHTKKVLVVSGPNLGRLGVRQPDVYGSENFETLREKCEKWGAELGFEVEVRQSDDEAQMVHWMHEAADTHTPVVMNPAAFTHYSYTLLTWFWMLEFRSWKCIFLILLRAMLFVKLV